MDNVCYIFAAKSCSQLKKTITIMLLFQNYMDNLICILHIVPLKHENTKILLDEGFFLPMSKNCEVYMISIPLVLIKTI